MIKIDLARTISVKTGTSLRQAEDFLDAFINTVSESLGKKDKVVLAGFGTFDIRHYPERSARNPRTGESLIVPATSYPTFRAGKNLKERVALGKKSKIKSNGNCVGNRKRRLPHE